MRPTSQAAGQARRKHLTRPGQSPQRTSSSAKRLQCAGTHMQRRRRGGSTTTPTSDPMRSHVRRASEGEDGAPLLPASDAVAPLEMEAGSYRHQSGLRQPPAGAAGADDGGAAGGSKAPRHQPLRLAGGLEVQPELLAIVLVYCTQGLLGLSHLGMFTFLKADLGLAPATVGFITSLSYAPWMIKPLYGFLSDTLPLAGYRRRSYLLLCGLLGASAWAAMATVVASPATAIAALVLSSAATACSDVVADSVVVEMSRGESQSTAGRLQSLCWASASAGGVLSAYFSGSLVETYGPRPVFWATAGIATLVMGAAAAIPEERIVSSSSGGGGSSGGMATLRAQASALWGALRQRSILLPALFVFVWQATPTADTAMMFFETNQLGFTTEFLGRIRLVSSVASLAGVGVFNFLLRDVAPRKMFLWTALLGTGLGMTQLVLITGLNQRLGLSNELFALGDSALLTVLGQVSFMPVLVLAARLCPEGVEATLFATLMSILNAGSFSGSALGSLLTGWFGVTSTDFEHLAPLVAVCTLSTLAPLPLLFLLGEDKERRAHGGGGGGGGGKTS